MNIYLKKVRTKTLFSKFEPIKVEPLELCYLKKVAEDLGHNCFIIDELFHLNVIPREDSPLNVIPSVVEGSPLFPHIIALTGYNVAENQILKEAEEYKGQFPDAKIIVGGVHVQLNSSCFHKPYIDYVIHSHSIDVFRNVISRIQGQDIPIKGFDFNYNGEWIIGGKVVVDYMEEIYPDREFFYTYKNQIYYLEKREVALIKGSVGCPYKCSYCYCRELNGGRFIKTDYSKLVKEMSAVDAYYFWIVDDVLFTSRQDALCFIDESLKVGFKKKFIAYLRADFILREKDLLSKLRDVGLDEIIIGFEAISQKELKEYNKGTNAVDYPQAIRSLKENHIDYTALFMVKPEYGIKEFRSLYRFIKDNGIQVFTLSIFTPMKGTVEYDESRLTKTDPKYFDFLHLVTKSRLPKPLFYLLFYGIHLRMLKSKRIINYLLRKKE